MGQSILKDSSNRIWLDASGKAILNRPFNQQVLQNGLHASFDFDLNNFNLSGTDITSWIATNNSSIQLSQAITANKPTYDVVNQAVNFNKTTFTKLTLNNVINTKSVFIIFKSLPNVSFGSCVSGFGTNENNGFLNGSGNQLQNQNQCNFSSYFGGNIKHPFKQNLNNIASGQNASSSNWSILSFTGNPVSDWNVLGSLYTPYGSQGVVKHLSIYNRVLSEQEVLYNINALNAKYGVF